MSSDFHQIFILISLHFPTREASTGHFDSNNATISRVLFGIITQSCILAVTDSVVTVLCKLWPHHN